MRLASFRMVSQAVAERDRLLSLRAAVEGGKLGVTIHGTYQDEAMVALVKPMVILEINGRIRATERDLVELGVTVA